MGHIPRHSISPEAVEMPFNPLLPLVQEMEGIRLGTYLNVCSGCHEMSSDRPSKTA